MSFPSPITAKELMETKNFPETIGDKLPYGMWVCADGRLVLFNRSYHPLAERVAGKYKKLSGGEWIEHIDTVYFYDDNTSLNGGDKKTKIVCERILEQFELSGSY